MAQNSSMASSEARVASIPASSKRVCKRASHELKASAHASRIGSLVLATSNATVAIGHESTYSVSSITCAATSKNCAVPATTSLPGG